MSATLHPLAQRILSGSAPTALCLAAARGAVPVPPEDLLRVRVHLASHAETAVAQASRDALRAQPAAEVAALIAEVQGESEVLAWLARERGAEADLIQALLRHPATPDDSLAVAAAAAPLAALESICDSQERLLRSLPLLEAVEANPVLTPQLRARLLDVREELARLARRAATAGAAAHAREIETGIETVFDAPGSAAPAAEDGAEGPAPSEAEAGADAGAEPDAGPVVDAFHEDGEMQQSDAFQRIMAMSIPDKAQLAVKGNREERNVLVRSVVKLVALSVLKNPRLTETDVEGYAAMRNVCDEVIWRIAENKEWTKSYAVVLALCRNPKSPTRRTLTLMSRLTNRDLKLLSGDKGVPEVVRAAANRYYVARTQPVQKHPGRR